MPEKKVSGEAKLIILERPTAADRGLKTVHPGDVVVEPGEPYYAGGTVPKRAPVEGVVMKAPHDPSY
ncbi:MAG: hypothetical protein US53_C0063G0003 [Candidatus Woesebacteria bacterium GW2011_GWA1_37_7]|uniref:Uncharacterized protein n=1 Tax=Candidatus Woesebacteria bacterium GW2011_GWA1_37_7 TaxID=1618545 RepID=A0A0G0K693_9BACT|nr:MAG: hypothetical protein US53_C0063G0003 [Candidatus Woesebacteria bacterium GW2011_GWA1_37_7]